MSQREHATVLDASLVRCVYWAKDQLNAALAVGDGAGVTRIETDMELLRVIYDVHMPHPSAMDERIEAAKVLKVKRVKLPALRAAVRGAADRLDGVLSMVHSPFHLELVHAARLWLDPAGWVNATQAAELLYGDKSRLALAKWSRLAERERLLVISDPAVKHHGQRRRWRAEDVAKVAADMESVTGNHAGD